jgi:hypothetical protein
MGGGIELGFVRVEGRWTFGTPGPIVSEARLTSALLISGRASGRPDVPRWRPKH